MNLIELLGPTAVASIICLIVGFVLLLIEMFTPGVGAAGVSGVIALIAVAVMQFGWGNTRVAS
jgi:membrane-bound ClpP family serine protease